MLKKLLKHDFKGLSRYLLPVFFAVFGTIIFTTLMLFADMKLVTSDSASGMNTMLILVTSILTLLGFLAIAASTSLVIIFVEKHFYDTVINRQAYLTFTIPVKAKSILVSKTLSSYICALIGNILFIVGTFLIITIGLSPIGEELFSEFAFVFNSMFSSAFMGSTGEVVSNVILLAVNFFISPLYTVLALEFAFLLAAKISTRHRVLIGIAFYFCIGIVMSILSSVATFLISMLLPYSSSALGYTLATNIISLVLIIVFIITFFIFNNHFISKKYNIE